MRRAIVGMVLVAMALVASGCGTLFDRLGAEHPFAAPPYPGVVNDAHCVAFPDRGEFVLCEVWGLCGLPLDLAADTVLLPADLTGWALGYEREPRNW